MGVGGGEEDAAGAEQGEDAYRAARAQFVKMLIGQPAGEEFLKEAFPDLDLEPFRPGREKEVGLGAGPFWGEYFGSIYTKSDGIYAVFPPLGEDGAMGP